MGLLLNKKVLMAVGGLLVIIGIFTTGYKAGKNSEKSAWQERELELISQHDAKLKAALKKRDAEYRAQQEAVLEQLEAAQVRLTEIRGIEREIITTESECERIGADMLRLFNESISATGWAGN